LTGAESKQAYN